MQQIRTDSRTQTKVEEEEVVMGMMAVRNTAVFASAVCNAQDDRYDF